MKRVLLKTHKFGYSFAIALVLLTPRTLLGFEEPAVNLGGTTFFDGMARITKEGKVDSGFYFNQYLQYYRADRFNDKNGQAIPATPKLDVYTSLTQLAYQMEKPSFLGAHLGINALIPVVNLNPSPDNTFLNANGQVLGDVSVGPAIQFGPIMLHSHPLFMHRIEFNVIVPTGSYDRKFALNPGANFISFNPCWAGTIFLGSKIVASWRLHYLWNDVNDEPNLTLHPPGTQRVQAGDAIHLNFSTACDLYDHRFYVGVNGYYLKQISKTRINDVPIPGLEEQVLGIGPGAFFRFSHNASFFLNLYFETAVENRPVGTRLNAVFAFDF